MKWCWRWRARLPRWSAFFEQDHTQRTTARVMCSHQDDQGRACATKLLWTRVQGDVLRALARTTLAELIAFSERSSPAVGVLPVIAPTGTGSAIA